MTYEQFLSRKQKQVSISGFDVNVKYLNPMLFDFQKYIVRQALQIGKYAIFADCGLGKTPMQLEWANQVLKHTDQPVLILAPLAVSGQTIEESHKFNIPIQRYTNQINPGVYISNYEQIDNIDTSLFSGVVLDESSILKNFAGATRKKLIDSFSSTPFKLCCTATPSPNDDMEMCTHVEFLNQGRREEILAMYFTHDGGETSKWRLKGHAVKTFWNFIKTWSCFVANPSDIGFDGSKFILPKLNLIEKMIEVPVKQGMLFNHLSISATNFNQELRETLSQRMDEVIRIVNGSSDNFIIWIKQHIEADYLLNEIPDAIEVRGSDSPEDKERKLLDFSHNKFRVLITKTKIAGLGMNFQNCHNMVDASLDFSFEGLYQKIRRSYRFGQKFPVNYYMITTDTMRNVLQSIKEKQEQFETMKTYLTNGRLHYN